MWHDFLYACPADCSAFPWMQFAFEELAAGVREIAPNRDNPSINRDNPRIREYLAAVNLGEAHDETAWCSAFVNWCMKQAGLQGTGRSNARSWLTWGKPNVSLATPCFGAVTILWRGQRNGWQGHVGFYVGKTQGKITLLGGNQGNKVSLRDYPEHRLLGYRWPAAYPLPA